MKLKENYYSEVGVAETVAAGRFAATIVVGNYVVLAIIRIPASTYPGYR